MKMNAAIAWTLRIGIAFGLILIVIGEIANKDVLGYGILLLILTPFIAIIVAFISLLFEKDKYWSAIALLLLIVVIIGMIISTL